MHFDSVQFSDDGTQVAVCLDDGIIQVWPVADPQANMTFVGSSVRKSILAFSADGKTLAGLLPNGVIKLWNIVTGREL